MGNIELLKVKKNIIRTKLMDSLCIQDNVAMNIIKQMEKEDYIRFTAPETKDEPATVLLEKLDPIGNEFPKIKTIKPGNIIFNLHRDLSKLIKEMVQLAPNILGIEAVDNAIGRSILIISCLISSLELISIELNENEISVILALQTFTDYERYMAEEHICMNKANKILLENGFPEMDETIFSNSIERLENCGCIKKLDHNIIKLVEKLVKKY